METKVIATLVLIISVSVALACGAKVYVTNYAADTPREFAGAEEYVEEERISVLSAEERAKYLAMKTQDPSVLSYKGLRLGKGGEGYDISYAGGRQAVPLEYEISLYAISRALENGIDPDLLFCMMWRESNFDPYCVCRNRNGTYDYGLLQLNTVNFDYCRKHLGITSVDDFLDPYINIDCCILYMSAYLKKYNNDYNKALMCYNLGEAGAQRKWNQGIYSTSYSRSITEKLGYYYVEEGYVRPSTTHRIQNNYREDSYYKGNNGGGGNGGGYDDDYEEPETVTEEITEAETVTEKPTKSREFTGELKKGG